MNKRMWRKRTRLDLQCGPFVAMLRSCTHRPKQFFFFLVSKEKEEEITTTIQSSAAMQQTYTCGKANCFFPLNKEEEEIGR